MPRKKIILSFDYELFFGYKSGTVRKSLIEPTNKMLDAMDQVGAKATYFVDYLMLKYLEKENDKRCNSDLELIKEISLEDFTKISPVIRDTIIQTILAKEIQEIEFSNFKLELQRELVKKINEKLGNKLIKELYFRDFIIS